MIKIIGDAAQAAFPTAPDAVAAVNGAPEPAIRLWAAGDQLRCDLRADARQASREAHTRFVRSLKERFEPERFAEAWARGSRVDAGLHARLWGGATDREGWLIAMREIVQAFTESETST